MKRKIILMLCVAAFAVMLALSASAVNVDGIEYSVKNGEATVTNANQSCTLTIVNIPETITVTAEHTEDASLHGTYTVTLIANSAFRNNSSVTEVTTPSTIKDIYEHAFREMPALTTVTLNASENFKCFRDAEFYQCKALKSIDMSGCVGLTGIGNGGTYDDTFVDCVSLETVVFPKGINYIGIRAFFNCSKLGDIENLDFSTVTYVGFKAFWGPKLTGDVILSENATYVGSHAFRETNITSIVMRMGSGSTQLTMDDATFYNCKKLKYVVLPDNIETVGQYTFSGCSSLEYVVLGGVKAFSTRDTFSGCGALKAIIYKGSKESFEALSGISALGTVEYKDFSEYVHGTLPATRTVYYGATTCDLCNGILGEESFKFASVLDEMRVSTACIHCNSEDVKETFDPVIVDLGYSTFESNGKCSIVHGYKVEYDSIEKYNAEFSDNQISAIGVLAVADSKVEDVAFDENGNALAGVISYEMKTNHNYVEIKVIGISSEEKLETGEAYTDVKLYMCAYVSIGGEIYYISNDSVANVLGNAVSYNSEK